MTFKLDHASQHYFSAVTKFWFFSMMNFKPLLSPLNPVKHKCKQQIHPFLSFSRTCLSWNYMDLQKQIYTQSLNYCWIINSENKCLVYKFKKWLLNWWIVGDSVVCLWHCLKFLLDVCQELKKLLGPGVNFPTDTKEWQK